MRDGKNDKLWLCLLVVAGGCANPGEPPAEPIPVPFLVSDYYSPDGYYGDGETRGFLDVQRACPDRPPASEGDCYTVTYIVGPKKYAGVFWQYPHNNWGIEPGRKIAAGATKITFSVKGQMGGEKAKFSAGQSTTPKYHDVFHLSPLEAALTTSWETKTVLLRGETYSGPDGLLGAFEIALDYGMIGKAGDTVVFYLTNLRWEQ
jgi:hypothetical protein